MLHPFENLKHSEFPQNTDKLNLTHYVKQLKGNRIKLCPYEYNSIEIYNNRNLERITIKRVYNLAEITKHDINYLYKIDFWPYLDS